MDNVQTFEMLLTLQQSFENDLMVAGDKLKKFPVGNMGLTPDHIRMSPEYKKAKQEYQIAFEGLRRVNGLMTKHYKKQYTEHSKTLRKVNYW